MTEITPEAQSQAKPVKTSITMVLDRSGSMEACRGATIDSVNAYLKKGRGDDNLKDADFELAIFDTEAYEVIRQSGMSAAKDIARDEFVPRGGTPLLDAVGRGIDGLDKRAAEDKAILVIVTDGFENSSRKHTYESIKALLDDRQKRGWLVLFLGAGLDSAREGLRMGVPSVNVASIGLDEAHLMASMDAMAKTNVLYSLAPNQSSRQEFAGSEKFSRKQREAMGDETGGDGIIDTQAHVPGFHRLWPTKKPSVAPVPPPSNDDTWAKSSGDAWGG